MTAIKHSSHCAEVRAAIDHVTAVSEPESMFLYGSRARGDARASSDYEFAAVYRHGKLARRSQLIVPAPAIKAAGHRLVVYPFRLADLSNGRADTPFPASIFLNEIHETAVGLVGPSPRDIVVPPPVRVADAVADCFLATGRALAGLEFARLCSFAAAARQVHKARYTSMRISVLMQFRILLHRTQDLDDHAETIFAGRGTLGSFNDSSDSAAVQRALYEAISLITQVLLPDLQSRPPSSILLPARPPL